MVATQILINPTIERVQGVEGSRVQVKQLRTTKEVKESKKLLEKLQNVMLNSFQHLGPNHRFGVYCGHYKTL